MAAIPEAYRIHSVRGSLERDWEYWVILFLSYLLGGIFFFFLATRAFELTEPTEPERYARIVVGSGPAEVPGDAGAGTGVQEKKPVSNRKAAETAEMAKVGKVSNARDRILKQSLVGVIASRGNVTNSALARVFQKGGIGSEVDQVLGKVDQKSAFYSAGTGTGLEKGGSRGTGGPGAGGVKGVGLGGIGGVGTGYGGGGGDNVQLGLKATHEVHATLTKGAASVEGRLDAGLIDQVVRKNLPGLKYCYEKELNATPNLAGKILIQFTIGTTGEVTAAEVENSSMKNAAVEDCLLRRVRRWRFPRPDGGQVIVSYPFVFTSGK